MPPIPPVPIPPQLQLVPVTITRTIDGGFQAIMIDATNLEPSEPTTVFVYLSQRPFDFEKWKQQHRNRGDRDGRGDDNDRDNHDGRDWHRGMVSAQTPAGSVADTHVAYAYPAHITGVTTNGNGLRTTQSGNSLSGLGDRIRALVNSRLQERLGKRPSGSTNQQINAIAGNVSQAQEIRNQVEQQVNQMLQRGTTHQLQLAQMVSVLQVHLPHL